MRQLYSKTSIHYDSKTVTLHTVKGDSLHNKRSPFIRQKVTVGCGIYSGYIGYSGYPHETKPPNN